jgi:hypothetical protein
MGNLRYPCPKATPQHRLAGGSEVPLSDAKAADPPRFRTIQVRPKDVGSACWHSPTRLSDGIQTEAAFKPGEQIMFGREEPLSCFEMSAIISICGLLFLVAFRDGNLLWAIPAMTLFSLSGMALLSALCFKPEEPSALAVS